MGKRRERPHSANWDPKGESSLALDTWTFSFSFPSVGWNRGEVSLLSPGPGQLCRYIMGRRGPQEGQTQKVMLKAHKLGQQESLSVGMPNLSQKGQRSGPPVISHGLFMGQALRDFGGQGRGSLITF